MQIQKKFWELPCKLEGPGLDIDKVLGFFDWLEENVDNNPGVRSKFPKEGLTALNIEFIDSASKNVSVE